MTISQESIEERVRAKLNKSLAKLPDTSGVYFFLGKNKKILYIGKATSIRNRVRSYFSKDIGEKRSPLIEKMVEDALSIDFKKTDSVLEALILEADLIKKFTPPFNVADKDQKSWNFVIVTNEEYPRVLIERERNIKASSFKLKASFGPFTNGKELKIALKILRKIFPFRDKCKIEEKRPCFNAQIGLCPGVCTNKISPKEYAKTIKHIKLFFQGKKKELGVELGKEMKIEIKLRNFEEASKIKNQINALKHINDIALLKRENTRSKNTMRIEAYDIAHLSGKDIVGVMTVVEDGEINKNDYRMFKIKGQTEADDTKALREVLERRLLHSEWPYPSLIVVDGSTAQLNATKEVLDKFKKNNNVEEISIVAVTKDERHRAKEIKYFQISEKIKKEIEKNGGQIERNILLVNSEAHRFAITFHRKRRSKSFI